MQAFSNVHVSIYPLSPACDVNIVPSTSECFGCDTTSVSTPNLIISEFEMFSFSSKPLSNFEKIRDLEGHEHLLADKTHSPSAPQLTVPVARGPSWLTTIVAVICTAILSGLLGVLVGDDRGSNTDALCIRRTSQYCKHEHSTKYTNIAKHPTAPIVKDVGVKYSMVRFEGSLLKPNNFKLDAGPEVDAAWRSLGADCKLLSVCMYSSNADSFR
jgi:hypothetical protein